MLYDITPPIDETLSVWPGDTPPSRELHSDIRNGAASTSSVLRTTVHLGAHADAPSHYGIDGQDIAERALDYYLGRCQVIRVTAARRTPIEPEDLTDPVEAERVLVATGTYANRPVFDKDFAALSLRLIDFFAEQRVKLVGIDTPSVDLFGAAGLPVHRRFLKHDMALLEGLVLQDVPAGIYELIALPLKLVGFDGSPVRAVLRTQE